MEATPTLLCIPDISGFTEFMSTTDIELSSKIIPSLLNKVIYANEIGLKVSEIEGDAVLFYRPGDLPPLQQLVDQCVSFYTQFYEQLRKLHSKHKAEKEGETIEDVLGLKIVLHYGKEVSAVPIGKNIKLMGEDVIVAHRLLKNKIPVDEYILISGPLLEEYSNSELNKKFDWGMLHAIDTSYEHIGDISYKYINLRPLLLGDR